jgi:peptidoglycan/LPS O-acetylase OafA/YrhL
MNRATSLYLDLFRPVAALIVLLSHIHFDGLTGDQFEFISGAGVQAVDAFFVLSGFVIAHVCAVKERDFRTYFVSRAARIYSVAVPAIILTALLDTIGLQADSTIYENHIETISPGLLVRSVAFMGEQWNAHRVPGSDSPYWSLGFEVWYYVAFAAYRFLHGPGRWLAALAALVFIGPKVAIMFPAWLIGVASYKFSQRASPRNSVGWFLFVSSFVILAAYQFIPHSPLQQFTTFTFSADRLLSTAQDYLLALVFGINIVGFVIISDRFAPLLERHAKAIRWVAGGTFSLYLAHLPIMYLLAATSPWPKSSPYRLATLLIVTPLACMAFAEISERRKHIWRRLIASATLRIRL